MNNITKRWLIICALLCSAHHYSDARKPVQEADLIELLGTTWYYETGLYTNYLSFEKDKQEGYQEYILNLCISSNEDEAIHFNWVYVRDDPSTLIFTYDDGTTELFGIKNLTPMSLDTEDGISYTKSVPGLSF